MREKSIVCVVYVSICVYALCRADIDKVCVRMYDPGPATDVPSGTS